MSIRCLELKAAGAWQIAYDRGSLSDRESGQISKQQHPGLIYVLSELCKAQDIEGQVLLRRTKYSWTSGTDPLATMTIANLHKKAHEHVGMS